MSSSASGVSSTGPSSARPRPRPRLPRLPLPRPRLRPLRQPRRPRPALRRSARACRRRPVVVPAAPRRRLSRPFACAPSPRRAPYRRCDCSPRRRPRGFVRRRSSSDRRTADCVQPSAATSQPSSRRPVEQRELASTSRTQNKIAARKKMTRITTIDARNNSPRDGHDTLFISPSTEIKKSANARHLHHAETRPTIRPPTPPAAPRIRANRRRCHLPL